MAEIVVVGLFAAVFQEQAAVYQGVGEIPEHGARVQAFGGFAGDAATFGMREGHKARDALLAAQALFGEAFGGHQRDLPGTQAGRQNQTQAVRGHAVAGADGVKGALCCSSLPVVVLNDEGHALGFGTILQVGQMICGGLPPGAPNRNLRVGGPFAFAALSRRDFAGQVKHVAAQVVHRRAIQIRARVDIHILAEQAIAFRGGHDFEGGHKGEICDRAVARNKEDQIASRSHLPGNAFEVIARAIHKIVARLRHGRGVVDHRVEAHIRVAFHGRADRFEDDVVQPAKFVAPRRVAFCGCAVPRGQGLVRFDFVEKALGHVARRDVLQDIRLRADEFVRFREIGRAAIADDFPRHPRRQWIAGNARKRIGSAALQRDFDVRQGFGGAGHRIDLR